MRVKDIMTRDVEPVTATDSIQAVACKMRDLRVGFMPVQHNSAVIGVLTDRDLTVRAIAEGLSPDAPVEEVATAGAVTCRQDEELLEVAGKMMANQVRRILVLNRREQPVGVVSLGDLAVTMDPDHVGKILKGISEPSEPVR